MNNWESNKKSVCFTSRFSTNYLLSFLFLLSLCISNYSGISQNKNDLKNKTKKLKSDIEYRNKLLQATKRHKQTTLGELVILNKKISSREQLIKNINKQISYINRKIEKNNDLITSMNKDLRKLKKEYATMIFQAYKNRDSYDKLMFIFSSKDFNQAYKRLKYYQQYTEYRKKQAVLIEKTQAALDLKRQELVLKIGEKKELLSNEKQEKLKLSDDKQEHQKVYSSLSSQEKKLRRELKKKEKERKKLLKVIQKIIEEELKKEKAKRKANTISPEALKLSSKFISNKSKLPWPVEKGVITGKFGEHPHPILKEIKVKNNGMDFSTTKTANARAIFDGEVTSVLVIPGVGKAIMLRHGEFLSVYSNLKETFVKTGDKVITKQKIGSIITDDSNGKTELHFELWKGRTLLNPSQWIYKAK